MMRMDPTEKDTKVWQLRNSHVQFLRRTPLKRCHEIGPTTALFQILMRTVGMYEGKIK